MKIVFLRADFVLVLSAAVIVLVIGFSHIDYEYENQHELGCGHRPAL